MHLDEIIEGKYLVRRHMRVHSRTVLTDNPREAIWEANKDPDNCTITNLCGDKEFYREDKGAWRFR